MSDQSKRVDPPSNVRQMPVASDDSLSKHEKELRMVGSNDSNEMVVSTEIPTIVKWLQSIPSSSFDWIRTDGDGAIVACKARVPKGVVKLQATARKSDTHSQMVAYGDARGESDDE